MYNTLRQFGGVTKDLIAGCPKENSVLFERLSEDSPLFKIFMCSKGCAVQSKFTIKVKNGEQNNLDN